MTKIDSTIYYRLKEISKLKPENIPFKLEELLKTIKPISKRTDLQNNALHKNFEILAEKLNDMGLDMRKLLKQEINIPWTTQSVKEHIWRPIQKAMYNIQSTTDLPKLGGEIDKIHEVIMRELGEKHGVEYHNFPHDPQKLKKANEIVKIDVEYPTHNYEPKF